MKYVLTIAIMLSLSFGLITESFRYQSTARLFEDDYDLLFEPARIPQIEGSRLWTSLANFVSGSEEFFSNGSVPYVLVGGATNLGKYYPGVVYDQSQSIDALYTGLDDPNGNPLYGDGELSQIDWIDSDGNGVFDGRNTTTETRSAYNTEKYRDIYFALGTKLNGIRLGIGFMRNYSRIADTDPANNFTYSYTEEDLTTSTTTFQSNATSSGDNVTNSLNNNIILSTWFDKENMSIGLGAEFDLISQKNEAVIIGDTTIYTAPANPATDHTIVNTLDSLYQPQSGKQISVNLKLFRDYNENAQGRFYVSFYMRSLNYSDDAISYYYKTRENIYEAPGVGYTWDTTSTITYYDGGSNRKGIAVATKQLFDVSDRLKFGFGLGFNTYSYFDSTTARDTSVAITHYDDNDGMTNDPDDYVQTVWSSQTWMTKVTGSVKAINIPVGVEFYLAEPLVFRLGAEHTLAFNNYTTVTDLIQYEPQRTRTVDGTGAVNESMEDPPNQPVGSEETRAETNPSTNYFYGLGWQVNENLQIDIMGFSEITNLSNWRISATLKFD